VERFREILNPAAPNALREPTAIERARAYYAACLIALGRSDEADAEIEKVMRSNPVYSPDPVAFPSKVVDRFIEIKSRLKGEIEAASRARAAAEHAVKAKAEQQQRDYIESLRRLASQESVVVRHSRWIAMVPFGAGQFQNGQEELGYALLVTESALAVASVASNIVLTRLVADYSTETGPVNYRQFNSSIDTAYDVNLYSTVALGAIALAGIIHAQVTFVPEVQETRLRAVPPPPSPPPVVPKVGAGPSGLFLGISGRFLAIRPW
jgi:hypothetical protein